ncbi:unnamed protein product [marine sediment metagenome]|uniref:Uncharacterized protein n=1 Tax=marine sediment metagenome TaxID=412755 RepID=X0SFV2_9ZZZZ
MLLRTVQKKMKKGNKDFAEFLGVSPGWLSSYYYGRIKEPSAKICSRIIRRCVNNKVTLNDLRSMQGRGSEFNRYG